MSYLPRNRTRRSYRRNILALFALFIAGAILFSFFDNLLITAVSPLWRAENGFSRGIAKSIDFFSTRNALIKENAALKERLVSMELERSELGLKRSEVENLQALLGRTINSLSITAAILTRPPQSPYDLVVIDAGSRDSVTVGARVTLPEGPEIGMISDVFLTFSKVKLFSTAGEKTNAVLERHQVPVTLEGSGGGNFRIIVPRETEVVIGDRILSSTLDSRLVAVVEDIEVTPTDSFKEILAKSPTNIFTIRFISIIR